MVITGADPCRAFSARRRKEEDYTARNTSADALTRAHMHGLLDLRCCGLSVLPSNLASSFSTRPIRVLDARYGPSGSRTDREIPGIQDYFLGLTHSLISGVAPFTFVSGLKQQHTYTHSVCVPRMQVQ